MTVYFVRHNNLIKIGFTEDLEKRFQQIKATTPVSVEFLGHMPGDKNVEAHLHQIFDAFRFSGEWFAENESLMSLIFLLAIKEMPAKAATPKFRKRLKNDDAWSAEARRAREFAAHRWPMASHQVRTKNLAALLGWGERRVRSLYQDEDSATLRAVELEQLNAVFTTDAETMMPERQEN